MIETYSKWLVSARACFISLCRTVTVKLSEDCFYRSSSQRFWLSSVCVAGAVTKVITSNQSTYRRTCELWHVGTGFKVRLVLVYVIVSWDKEALVCFAKGPFTQAIFVVQFNASFVALKLQLQNLACKPAAISVQF